MKPGEPATAGPAQLAAPGELLPDLRPRAASYVETDLQKDGANFADGLPNNLVSTDSAIGVFSPNFIPADSLTAAAFATYDFNVSGYDRNPQVRYEWDTAPGPGHLWLGLADWDANAWRWFKPDPTAPLNLPTIAPYIRADGELLVVVLVTGTQQDRLASLRIGSQPPQIILQVTNAAGFVPFTANLDAGATSDPDGTLAKFEWDLDGNGSFEVSGSDSTQDADVGAVGVLEVKLRVTDNDGVSAGRTVRLRGFGEWIHSWGGGGQDEIKDCAYDEEQSLYFAGSTSSFGSGALDMLLLKYDLSGSLIWAHTWGSAATEAAWAAAVDSAGNLVVAGKFNSNLGLAKFSPEGECLWAKAYSYSSYSFEPRDIVARGTDIYLCGFASDISQPLASYGFLARIDADGDLQWLNQLTGSTLTSLQLYSGFVGSPLIHAAGSFAGDILYLRAGIDGEFLRADKWGNGVVSETGADISVTGVGLSPTIWLAGVESSGLNAPNIVLVQYLIGETPECRVWDGGAPDLCQGLMQGVDGRLLLCTRSAGFSANEDSVLLGFNGEVSLEHSSRLTNAAASSVLNRPQLLFGTAIAVGGACGAAAGSSWIPCSGTSATRFWTWNEVVAALSPVSIVQADAVGSLGTPSSAVLDSGGGGPSDALAVVREAP